MGYKYELHTHNAVSSKCGRFTPEQIVDYFVKQEYTGICTTDHFINGNTTAPGKEEPWKYRIEKFCEGYERTKAVGDKKGLDVFFGFEYTVPYRGAVANSDSGCDFLVFGIDGNWLTDNGGDVETCSTNEYLNRCRKAGGTVIQAHPFRLERSYMNHICLFPDCVDGVETLNASPNTLESNYLARAYADYYGFFHTAGSDIHWVDRDMLGVTELPEKAHDIRDMMRMLKEKRHKIYLSPAKFKSDIPWS